MLTHLFNRVSWLVLCHRRRQTSKRIADTDNEQGTNSTNGVFTLKILALILPSLTFDVLQ